MRIGVLADLRVANTAYRAAPVVALSAGQPLLLDVDAKRAELDRLGQCDVVHVSRFCDRTVQQLARRLSDAGVAIVWDIDDDVSAVPDRVPGRFARGGLKEQQMLRGSAEMTRLADVTTTTSEPLAELYRSLGADVVRIVPNFVPDEFAQQGRLSAHDGIVVGWVASSEHYHDLRQLGLSETLRRLLDERPELRVASVGVRFDLPADRYDYRMMVQFRDLAQHVAGFDVGLAPVTDVPFNRARSDVKVKEYAVAGVPWLASPIGPYAGYGEKQGGRLVPDDGWYAAIDRLVSKHRERRKLAKRAATWGASQTLSSNLGRWEEVMQEAVERARSRR